jgi:hypothetical protein
LTIFHPSKEFENLKVMFPYFTSRRDLAIKKEKIFSYVIDWWGSSILPE